MSCVVLNGEDSVMKKRKSSLLGSLHSIPQNCRNTGKTYNSDSEVLQIFHKSADILVST